MCRVALFACLITLAACVGPHDDPGVRRELAEASQKMGLALMQMDERDPLVIPFDAPERRVNLSAPDNGGYKTSGSGNIIAWLRAPSLAAMASANRVPSIEALQSELVIRTIVGGEVARHRFWGTVGVLALNESGRRLVLISNPSPSFPRGGVYWQSFDFSSGGFIDDVAVSASWSPDGAQLVYQKADQIRIFDVKSASSRSFLKGVLQEWSPNGKWIVIENENHRPMLVTPEGVSVNWFLSRRRIVCCLNWSPDGRFVTFNESITIPLLGGGYERRIVCRVADGGCVSLTNAPAGLRWIVNYRSLLARHSP